MTYRNGHYNEIHNNGRYDSSNDNFTSVSTKGLAVVDYLVVPQSSFIKFDNFKVVDTLDVCNIHEIPVDSTIPDHRLITSSFSLPVSKSITRPIKQTKVIKRIPEGYFQEGNGTAQLELGAHSTAPKPW